MDLGTALLALGTQVVKSACRLWLGSGFTGNMADTVADLLKDQVPDAIQRHRLKGMFEGFAGTVADKAKQADDPRFRSLPESERIAAVLAVAETFANAELNDAALFAMNLDARALEKHLSGHVEVRERAWGLSGQATGYLEFLLRECCSYLLETKKTLPPFTSQALTELLRRSSTIEQQLAEMLERLPARTGMTGDEGFETDYRRLIADELDYMDLFGASVFEHNRGYQLSVAYISLLVTESAGQAAAPQPTQAMAVESVLAESRRIFVRGEAGSGKTTLLHWIAVCAARHAFPDELSAWADLVPFFVQLRHFADGRPLPPPEEFLRTGAAAGIAAEMPEGWVHRILRAGRGIVLIDGVDEVPQLQREAIAQWLRGMIAVFPESHFVVTSRPAAVGEDWLAQQRFRACFVQPMDLPDVRRFIQHWHKAMALTVVENTAKQELARLTTALIKQVEARRHLRQLATNPLMCALLCALNRDRRAELPRNRIDLYRISLEMFLERRDSERRMQPSELQLDLTDQLRLLQLLAYWMMTNDLAAAERDRVLNVIYNGLVARRHRISHGAEQVLVFLLERSGVIRQPLVGWIDFIHRSFQEFLAAQAAVDSDDIEALTARAADDQWRQVVILAAGLGNRQQTNLLLNRLLHPPPTVPEEDHVLLDLTALSCMETVAEVGPEVASQIRNRAGLLVPPRGREQEATLSRLGDFALELLAQARIADAPALRSTVLVAASVGGEQGLNLIAKVCADLIPKLDTPEFTQTLLEVWPEFDPVEFSERVLAQRGIQRLSSANPSLIPAITRITSIKNIVCKYGNTHSDFRFLAELPDLRNIEIEIPASTGPLSIATPANLQRLELVETPGLPPVYPDATPAKTLVLSGGGAVRWLSTMSITGEIRHIVVNADGSLENLFQLRIPGDVYTLELHCCQHFRSLQGAAFPGPSALKTLIIRNPSAYLTFDAADTSATPRGRYYGTWLIHQLNRIELICDDAETMQLMSTVALHKSLVELGFTVRVEASKSAISIVATRHSTR